MCYRCQMCMDVIEPIVTVCDKCNGNGRVKVEKISAYHGKIKTFFVTETCPECGGKGSFKETVPACTLPIRSQGRIIGQMTVCKDCKEEAQLYVDEVLFNKKTLYENLMRRRKEGERRHVKSK